MDQRIPKLARGTGLCGQPYRGPGWYLVPEFGFPARLRCLCGSLCVEGQIVYCVQYEQAKLRKTFAFHKECMQEALDDAPLDDYETIRERVTAGGPLWTE